MADLYFTALNRLAVCSVTVGDIGAKINAADSRCGHYEYVFSTV
jgi:hypothetical protein